MAFKDPRIAKISKVNLVGGQAKPGPVLASVGVNMGEFIKKFNDATKDRNGEIIPCIIVAYKDKSFRFELKTTPTAVLLKKAANIETGAKNAKTEIVGTVSKKQILEIAKIKMQDSNANDVEACVKMIEGTAKQMGIKIEK